MYNVLSIIIFETLSDYTNRLSFENNLLCVEDDIKASVIIYVWCCLCRLHKLCATCNVLGVSICH